MKIENLEPITRMIVREVALGLSDEDVCINHPEFNAAQIAKMRAGATFKRALTEMQKAIDHEVVNHAASDPVRQYMQGKGMSMAKTLVSLAENTADGEEDVPYAVRAKAADSILSKTGYGNVQEAAAVPVLMLSPEKLKSVLEPKQMALESVPDCVDGHAGDLGSI